MRNKGFGLFAYESEEAKDEESYLFETDFKIEAKYWLIIASHQDLCQPLLDALSDLKSDLLKQCQT